MFNLFKNEIPLVLRLLKKSKLFDDIALDKPAETTPYEENHTIPAITAWLSKQGNKQPSHKAINTLLLAIRITRNLWQLYPVLREGESFAEFIEKHFDKIQGEMFIETFNFGDTQADNSKLPTNCTLNIYKSPYQLVDTHKKGKTYSFFSHTNHSDSDSTAELPSPRGLSVMSGSTQ